MRQRQWLYETAQEIGNRDCLELTMKTYSIAEINDLDHGIPISRFEGRIKKVFEQKSGEGNYGTWYLQNLIVEDGQQEITVTWTGDDPFDAGVEGKIYSFET